MLVHRVEGIAQQVQQHPTDLLRHDLDITGILAQVSLDLYLEIRVSDNGPGIPAEIKDKIFEPFFTTKPTGSGTGLGLSLSYDIVTQGHGGMLTVENEEGMGAMFIITLPVEKTS